MFRGLTFDNQNVTSKNDGGLYDRIFSKDGILRGCSMSVSGASLIVQPGLLVIGGRLVWVDSATPVEFQNPITNGYGRVILTIDLSRPASADDFAQLQVSVDYSATTTFPSLKRENINGERGALIYEAALAVVSIVNGNPTSVTSTIGNTQIDADLLGGQPRSYYSVKSSTDTEITNLKNKITPTSRGSANNANSLADDGWWLCSSGIPSGIGTFAYVLQATYLSNAKMQIACPYNPTTGSGFNAWTSAPVHFRFMYPYSSNKGWSPWHPIETGNASTRGSANNANSLPYDGWWLCNSGIPSGIGSFAYVQQITYSSIAQMQMAYPYSPVGGNAGGARTSAPLYYRIKYTYSDTAGWNPWQPVTIGNPGSRGSDNNANSLPWDGWWLCRDNIPTSMFANSNSYCYVLQETYGARKMQLALPYMRSTNDHRTIAYRLYHDTAGWSAWLNLMTADNIGHWIINNFRYLAADQNIMTKILFPMGAYLWGYSDGTFGWRAKSLNILQLNNSSAGTPITAGTYTTVSARKTKTAIEDLDLEKARKLLDLNPVEFELRDDKEHKKHYGMIAEDVAEIDSVPVTRDDKGKIVGLDYQGFIAPLIRLVQEQERRIDELESKLDKLEK